MKKFIALLFAAALSWCVAAIAVAETNEQVVKENTIAKTAKQISSDEKMMPTPEVQLKRLTKGLKLTAEQQKLISPMLEDEYAKLKELRQADNLNLSPKQIGAKVEALRSETASKMQTVLTPEQKKNYDIVRKEIRANKKKRIKENRKGRIGIRAEPLAQ
ncbi:MAG: hypothetical protein M0T70_16125 [Geobacteraceae bacterium]|nr:hypothetical protein [Geobacteraceae bacterium]